MIPFLAVMMLGASIVTTPANSFQSDISVPRIVFNGNQTVDAWLLVDGPGRNHYFQVGWIQNPSMSMAELFTECNSGSDFGAPGDVTNYYPSFREPVGADPTLLLTDLRGGDTWYAWVQRPDGMWTELAECAPGFTSANADYQRYLEINSFDGRQPLVGPVRWTNTELFGPSPDGGYQETTPPDQTEP